MKKMYISCDMEGITGICSNRQRNMGDQLYAWGQKMMARELSTVVNLFAAKGVGEFVVNDSHNNMLNLLIDELPEQVSLISGSHKTDSMMQGIGPEFDGAVFIGYHGRAGLADALLSHTYSESIYEVCLNGVPVGETTLNAAFCGYHGVPLLLASGDNHVADEVASLKSGAHGVIVKRGITRSAGMMFHPAKVEQLYREAIDRVFQADIHPFRLQTPVRMELTLREQQMADMVQRIPGMQRSGPAQLRFEHADYATVFHAFLATTSISSTNYLK